MTDESFSTRRLDSLLARIRESLHKTRDAFQSKAFCGSLDEVLAVTPEDVNAAVLYLVELGLCEEEAQQLHDEWERCWEEGGFLQVLIRHPPCALDYSASADDPDDPEVARVKQVNAERFADHERETESQRGIAVDAVSALLKRVDDLVEAVESMFRGSDDEEAAGGAGWEEIADCLTRLQGTEPYKGAKYYLEKYGWKRTTYYKAVKLRPSLQPWAKAESTSPPKATGLTEVVTDSTPQRCEADPADMMTDDEAQAILRRLIEQAPEGQRPELHKLSDLSPDELRRYMKPYADADDIGNRVLGRRP